MMLARFFQDKQGSAVPMLALAVIPMMGAIGAAIDYSHAANVRSAMQAAADSTALAMASDAAKISSTQLNTNADAYFRALFSRADLQSLTVTASYTSTGGSTVVANANGTVRTSFMGYLGVSQIPVKVSSTTTWGNKRLRVALVLDNTGSMADDGKMSALKTASHNLLASLKNAAVNDGDVYVSIIPFSKDVNVGSSNYNSSWIDWDSWDASNGSNVANGQTCTGSGWRTTCTTNYVWVPDNHNTWNGCVTDRDQNYDTMNTAPSSGGTLFPAEQYSSCPVSMMALSYNWTALNNKIDAMSSNGNTNQAIGLAWGWQSLTQSSPLNAPAKDSSYKYEDIIILLTDGLNTQDRWYTSQSSINTRQQKTCDNIKAAGVTLYTVQVNTGNDATSTLLKNCATDTTKFFLLTSANQIVTTFDQIGTSIAKLHIAK